MFRITKTRAKWMSLAAMLSALSGMALAGCVGGNDAADIEGKLPEGNPTDGAPPGSTSMDNTATDNNATNTGGTNLPTDASGGTKTDSAR